MLHKPLLAVLICFLSLSALSAQNSKLKRAKKYYDNLAYTEAIELYNLILEKEDNAEAKIYLADAYRKINDTENAEYWYGQVVRLPEAQPVHKLYYGMMLQRNGKCDLAREWYAQYVEAVPDDVRGQYLDKACDFEEELNVKNASIFEVKHLSINSNLDDFSPAFSKGGLIFASERDKGAAIKREHSWTGNPFLELYSVDVKTSKKEDEQCRFTYSRPKKFSSEINNKFHEAAVSFTPDRNEIFFTANNYNGEADDGSKKLKIYSAVSKGGEGWTDVQSLPFNSDEYSVAHPSLTPDGKRIYFTSDMPGGFGGMDLYYADLDGNRWSPPTNLGPTINTEGHEIFPYVGANNRIYFASDGQIGLGGLDIFFTEEKNPNEWSSPNNLGNPINSTADDFGIIFDQEGTCGYFSSDREGGVGGDDIYSFTKTAAPVEIYVYDEATDIPIEGATVVDSCTGITHTTNANGKISIDMKLNICCDFNASAENYIDNSKEGCTDNILLGDVLRIEIPMKSAEEYAIEGIVFDQQTGLPLEGATVELLSDTDENTPRTHITDATGQYSFELEKDHCYTLKASKELYLTTSVNGQCTNNLEQSTTLQTNLNLQPYTATNPDGIADARFIQDPDTGLWIDSQTGEPAEGNIGGVTYENGEIVATDSGFTKDPASGAWVDNETGELAEGTIDGVTYKDGEIVATNESTPNARIVKDNGIWIDTQTGEPAEGNINGVIYENGEVVATDEGVYPPGKTDREVGGITFLLHIYYDFDQSYIRDDAIPELEKLLTTLNDNPDLLVEIGSHTDSRGSYRYNNRLSQRRAEAVVRWLSDRGIDQDRLVAAGYGETINVNNCSNNVPCSEREHQLNRRTEFKIIGCRSCDYLNQTISAPNENVHVSECINCPFDD